MCVCVRACVVEDSSLVVGLGRFKHDHVQNTFKLAY